MAHHVIKTTCFLKQLTKNCFCISEAQLEHKHVNFETSFTVLMECRKSSRRRISRRGSWCERSSLWPVGNPHREFLPRSPSLKRSRTAMCLRSMTSSPLNCTGSKSRQVHTHSKVYLFL